MARDVRLIIAANIERAEQELAKLKAAGKDVSDRLANDFEQLGIRSTVAIEKERAATVAAYEKIKASGVASVSEISRAQAAMQAKLAEMDKENHFFGLNRNMKDAAAESRSLSNGLSDMRGLLMLVGGAIGVSGFRQLIADLREARTAMDAIQNSLAAGTQDAHLVGLEYEYVSQRAQYLGLNLRQTAQDYAQIVAAAKGTSLEGEATRKIFDGVTTASTALHLSADKTSRILVALNQMMSKGTVQAEELKQQVGEHLPGAYQMAAKAMGLTTAELSKQMEQGKIMASDLLPKLAEELERRFGKQIPDAIKSTQAEMNRLENKMFEFKLMLADSGMFASLARGKANFIDASETIIKWMGQAKVFWTGLSEKAAAWVNAGGLMGVITGGKDVRAEIKAQFEAIDTMTERGWDKWNERAGDKKPLADPQALAARRQQELDAAAAKAKEAAEKAKQEAAKIANEKKAFEEQVYKNQLEALQNQSKNRLTMLRFQHDGELAEEQDFTQAMADQGKSAFEIQLANIKKRLAADQVYYQAVVAEEKKSYDLQIANAQKHINSLVALRGTPGYADAEKSITLEKDIQAAIGAKSKLEMEFQNKRQQATFDAIRAEQSLADKIAEQTKRKIKEIEDLRLQFNESNRQWSDKRSEILGGPEQTAALKLEAAKDRLTEKEKEYSKLTDPQEKAKGLSSLVDAWSGLTEKIDFSTMSQSQKMMELNKIEDERVRLQNSLISAAENEKVALINTYDTAVQKVQAYKNELQLLDELIRGMSRDITVNLKVNGSQAISAVSGKVAADSYGQPAGSAVSVPSEGASADHSTYGGYSPYQPGGYNAYGNNQYGAAGSDNSRYVTYHSGLDSLPDGYMSITSAPSYDVGTNRVPRDGFAYLHKDEAVVPKKYNPAVGGQAAGSTGPGLAIETFQLVMPNVTNQTSGTELARQALPEIMRLVNERFRKTG